MSSTEFNIGITGEKTSSRVLKPPGGGHSDIFGSAEVKANPPRPKHNQQNSANMNGVMGTTDPNLKIEQNLHEQTKTANIPSQADRQSIQKDCPQLGRGRVPPGGFSSGLW
ncbi:microtubule-associated protein Jupiter [Malaya genurostris]|uniref:microtubule-associated protein Jupiter n=1 Tax=Malaya genurostris TaxID=325434 RepID=UPI0026F3E942|nr:microtubule-associated protein Jupiter [Malaya genurostris]